MTRPPRNIVICCDGTGNPFGEENSNVGHSDYRPKNLRDPADHPVEERRIRQRNAA